MNHENKAEDIEARLTAYAFGELEGDELAAMEAAVAADPLLAIRVEELRAFGGELAGALRLEPEPVSQPAPADAARPPSARGDGLLRFPTWAWAAAVGLAAAAGVAVLLSPSPRDAAPVVGERLAAVPDDPPAPGSETLVEHAAQPAAPARVVPEPPPSEAPVDGVPAARSSPPSLAETPPPLPPPSLPPSPPEPPPSEFVAVVPAPAPLPAVAVVDVDALLGKGRGQFAAGDLDGAAASFDQVRKLDAGNRQARYFSARIEQDRARFGGTGAAGIERLPLFRVPHRAGARAGAATRATTGAFEVAREAPGMVVAETGFVSAKSEPVSVLAADVDTAGYAEVRETILQARRLPAPDAVRIEELINYFPFDDPSPATGPAAGAPAPFAVRLAVASAPWAPERRLVRIALKGAEISPEARPPANLVFLVDVSVASGPALPLLKFSLKELSGRLRSDDHVAIVASGDAARLVLPPTPAARAEEIRAAIDALGPRRGVARGDGFELAYEVAAEHFRAEGTNRVIVCSDGRFGIDPAGRERLLALVREKAAARVYLSAFGFGGPPGFALPGLSFRGVRGGNAALELLAENGNGFYGRVDSLREARRLLAQEVDGALAVIAGDLEIRATFDPELVESYRLVGYDLPAPADRVVGAETAHAGAIGAGHSIVALYEIEPTSRGRQRARAAAAGRADRDGGAPLTLRIGHRTPEGDDGAPIEVRLVDDGAAFKDADADFKFTAAVAAWGLLLREGGRSDAMSFADVQRWAEAGLGADPTGFRADFVELVRRSRSARR